MLGDEGIVSRVETNEGIVSRETIISGLSMELATLTNAVIHISIVGDSIRMGVTSSNGNREVIPRTVLQVYMFVLGSSRFGVMVGRTRQARDPVVTVKRRDTFMAPNFQLMVLMQPLK